MKVFPAVIVLLAGLSVSACWDEASDAKRSTFAKELTRCAKCTIDKPFLNSGEDAGNGR